MVTLDEFERVQELLGHPGCPRPKRHQFAYTGMIRCGECGLSVTAEGNLSHFSLVLRLVIVFRISNANTTRAATGGRTPG